MGFLIRSEREFHVLLYDIKYVKKYPTGEFKKLSRVLKRVVANKWLKESTAQTLLRTLNVIALNMETHLLTTVIQNQIGKSNRVFLSKEPGLC